MKKVVEGERIPFKTKRIKRLLRKVKRAEREFTKVRMLLLFELGKEMDKDSIREGTKYEKTLA